VKLDRGDFIGRDALLKQRAAGLPRRLVGFRLDEPGVPRHGYAVFRDGAQVGTVTSGAKSPTLDAWIGLAYVTAGSTARDTAIGIEIRGRQLPAHVVDRPFYRRARQEG